MTPQDQIWDLAYQLVMDDIEETYDGHEDNKPWLIVDDQGTVRLRAAFIDGRISGEATLSEVLLTPTLDVRNDEVQKAKQQLVAELLRIIEAIDTDQFQPIVP